MRSHLKRSVAVLLALVLLALAFWIGHPYWATQEVEHRWFSDPSVKPIDYWQDLKASNRAHWLPLAYYRSFGFQGRYHHISSSGLRASSSYAAPAANGENEIGFFGGSTTWGIGARDEHTIPSEVSRALHSKYGSDFDVTNFAERGYTSTLELLLFQRQIQLGKKMRFAVFIDGFNEVLGALTSRHAGMSIYECNRIQDFDLGRALTGENRGSRVLLRIPFLNLALVKSSPEPDNAASNSADISLTSFPDDPASIVEAYIQNAKMIQLIARANKIEPLFIWQPTPFERKTLTPEETLQVESMYDAHHFQEVVRKTNTILKERLRSESLPVIDLTDFFEKDAGRVYVDFSHYSEDGNRRLAERIASEIHGRAHAD